MLRSTPRHWILVLLWCSAVSAGLAQSAGSAQPTDAALVARIDRLERESQKDPWGELIPALAVVLAGLISVGGLVIAGLMERRKAKDESGRQYRLAQDSAVFGQVDKFL